MSSSKDKCPLCDEPESQEMVQCDRCDQWHHFACVGVTADIVNKDWECNECCKRNQADPCISTASEKDKVGTEVARTLSECGSSGRSKKLELARLKEQRNAEIEYINKKYAILSVSDESDEFDDDESQKTAVSLPDNPNAQSGMQSASGTSKVCGLYRDNPNAQSVMQSASGTSKVCGSHRDNPNAQSVMQSASGTRMGREPFSDYLGAQRDIHRAATTENQERLVGGERVRADTLGSMCETSRHVAIDRSNYMHLRQDDLHLTSNNIHARQVIPQELPSFSGKPEEWPLFLSNFENSTRICGFSNEENMLRLQRALKGKALEYVHNQLLIPALVPQVVSTLKMIFGRPENIINSLVAKLRASPGVNPNKLDTLINFSLEVRNIAATMQASGLYAHLNNPMLIQELIEKLPASMRLSWAMHARSQKIITVTTLSDWLYESAEAASSIILISHNTQSASDPEKRKTQRVNVQEEQRYKELICPTCDEKHEISSCPEFEKASYDEKWQSVHKLGLCRSCLKQHNPQYCRERKECGVNNCTAKHHPKLHNPNKIPAVVASQHTKSSNVLYKIVPVTIYGLCGSIDTFAFLDDGSGPTLIDQSIVNKLGLDGPKSCLSLKWTDGTTRVEKDSKTIDLDISSKDNNKKLKLRDVRTVRCLDLPKQTLDMTEIEARFKHLQGLPIRSYHGIEPKIIIGLNNIRAAMPLKFREGKPYEPAAVKTRLGWIIFGSLGQAQHTAAAYSDCILQLHVHEWENDISLHKLVAERMQFNDLAFDHDSRESFTPERYPRLDEIVKRIDDIFITKLLWKQENLTLPNNMLMALRRLNSFEAKLLKDEKQKNQVNEKISQMKSKGYIRALTPEEVSASYPRKWYLPVFIASNPNKPNKVRLVWDAAAELQGTSLNKCLDKGPDLLTPLVDVLFNFRTGRIGISGDIREMYHRIGVEAEDQHSQRFLWRDCDKTRSPVVYALTVMSFGASCSPSIAQFVKNKNAYEYLQKYPRAAKSILERHYVDDMLDSVDSVEEAISLGTQVKEIHRHANFHIRGWLSNSREVLASLGDEGLEEGFCRSGNNIEQVFEVEKVLGLWWNTCQDTFTFSLKYTKASIEVLQGRKMPTKRELLRLLMSIFDPLGFLSFFTIHAKILLQKIWRSGTSWDEEIADDLRSEWARWLQALPTVNQVQVPRYYFGDMIKQESIVELHIFTDASEYAYAAVAYFRIVNRNYVDLSFVCSKSKVAPLRPVSVPRMELMAAVLGARLSHAIIKTHDLLIESTSLWTDSRTVLQWLQHDPRTFKQFVMFRVGEIQELTDVKNWRFVSSKNNVADLATKWKNFPAFAPHSDWFAGPDWLRTTEISEERNQEETEKSCQEEVAHHRINSEPGSNCIVDYTRFSKWERLHRCMAYVKKFMNRMLSTTDKQDQLKIVQKTNTDVSKVQNLTAEELSWSQHFLYRTAQLSEFSKEILLLQNDPENIIPAKSTLRKLSPYLDENGVIRQRIRIHKTALANILIVNPIVLPKSHYITRLIVESYHRQFKHVNHETVINTIFARFRIPGLRRLLRSVRIGCGICKIADAKPKPPEMGNLPMARTSISTRPFTYVGVDFFGPILVTVGRRSEKRYGVIFTCLTCRAVHLEVAYSLTTSSCILVVRNFIGRRGKPRQIFSDNGTNLRAADKTLRESEIDFRRLQNEFTMPDTKWTFIPPASPHMGGAWERLIRSVKVTMYKVVTPTTKLTDEVLHNLLVEIEHILNCRPLTYLSLETAEQEVLTPNHILLGSASGDKPPGIFSDRDRYVKQSWRHSQLLADLFWKRWVSEILPDMTGRTKWFDRVRPVEVGDICIIVDQNLPRHHWPKGIVTHVFPGKDGQVRSATVHTNSGDYHRPTAKLAILDVRSPQSTDEKDNGVFLTIGQDTGGENVTNSALD